MRDPYAILKSAIHLSGVLIFALAIGVSCSSGRSLAGRNINEFYLPDTKEIGAEALILHVDESSSRVYVKFNHGALAVNSKDDEPTLNYSIRYKLYSNYSSDVAMDSANLVRKVEERLTALTVLDSFDIPSTPGLNAVVELVIRDFNAGTNQRLFVDVMRSRSFGLQDALLTSSKGEWEYSPYLAALDSYNVHLQDSVGQLYARYYDRTFPISSPPFSTISPKAFNFTPDNIIPLKKLSDRDFRILIDRPGLYQVTDDLNQKYGASYFYFDKFYPDPKTLLALVEPLRYISTNEEYDQLTSSAEMKKEVDAFWLAIGNNPERARELIRAYYSRVRWANEHFSSYLEGWKSDRGMCYIVFGPPDAVYRSTSAETWLYGEAGNFNALSLTFTKVVNPFTFNDFRLNRSVSLRNPWYRAVEFWRQGRVITYR